MGQVNSKKVLGQVSFNIVSQGKFKGNQLAVRISAFGSDNEDLKALRQFNHPNIVKVCHMDISLPFFTCYVLKLRVAPLDKVCLKSDNPQRIIQQPTNNGPLSRLNDGLLRLASRLTHIHLKKLIHQNINPLGILISAIATTQPFGVTLKLADFRPAELNGGRLPITGIKATPSYFEPELLRRWMPDQKLKGNANFDVFHSSIFKDLISINNKLTENKEKLHDLSANYSEADPANETNENAEATRILPKTEICMDVKDDNGQSALNSQSVKNLSKGKISYKGDAILGAGGYAFVFKGEFEGKEVAVKRIQKLQVKDVEEELMKKLNHPNIVKLFHSESDDDFRYYALELCVASLDDIFPKPGNPKKYNEPLPSRIDIFLQLARGLEHMHMKNITHRDINPKNILISATPNSQHGEITIKLADFGLSKAFNENGSFSVSDIRGTPTWYAPEILRCFNKGIEHRGTANSDVFALALVFGYLLLNGKHLYGLYHEIGCNIIAKNPTNMHGIDGVSREFYEDNLLRKMLEDKPKDRMSSMDVVETLTSIKKKLAKSRDELEPFRP